MNPEYRLKKLSVKSSKKNGFSLLDLFWSFIGSFCGIAFVSFLNHQMLTQSDLLLIIGSFGASAVLIYGVPESPLSKTRNVIGGHMISAFIGVSMNIFFYDIPWLASALAVSLAITAMQLSQTVHPPGGATALIATIGSDKIKLLGFKYLLFPVGIGILLLLFVGVFINLLSNYRFQVNKPQTKNQSH